MNPVNKVKERCDCKNPLSNSKDKHKSRALPPASSAYTLALAENFSRASTIKCRLLLCENTFFSSPSSVEVISITSYNFYMGAPLRWLLRVISCFYALKWVSFRSRLPRLDSGTTLSYQPTSSFRQDVDCGVVSTYIFGTIVFVVEVGVRFGD